MRHQRIFFLQYFKDASVKFCVRLHQAFHEKRIRCIVYGTINKFMWLFNQSNTAISHIYRQYTHTHISTYTHICHFACSTITTTVSSSTTMKGRVVVTGEYIYKKKETIDNNLLRARLLGKTLCRIFYNGDLCESIYMQMCQTIYTASSQPTEIVHKRLFFV